MNKAQYTIYLKSSHWQLFRERVVLRAFVNGKYKCETCGELFRRNDLEVHHKHYRTLGHEKHSDVMVLCGDCHGELHGKADVQPVSKADRSRRTNVFAEIMAIAYDKLRPIHKRMIDGVITQKHFDAIKREYIDLLLQQRNRG